MAFRQFALALAGGSAVIPTNMFDRLNQVFAGGMRATGAQTSAWVTLVIPFVVEARFSAAADYVPSEVKPPAALREFRGAWVATVKNIDWPSQPGLTTARQKTELLALLDLAAQLRLNAVILQVRPACDALYDSKIEPWSEYLTGRMGRAPVPYYDPLAFAVAEAHRRGLELHAWFNPYRARHGSALGPVSRQHISKTRPRLVKTYGQTQWMDPGDREVQEYSLRVVMDVVERYDIDAVHFDDYFYPYEEKDARGQPLPFPDWSSWKSYRDAGGRLSKEDWRRENVNTFVRRVAQGIRTRKPWVRFGISPFGIWRPAHPPQIRGLDAYDKLYADARRWLVEGWVDYLAPQLYWPAAPPEQSFPALLQWWSEQNPRQRLLWPGLSHRNPATEIANQIRLTRRQPGASGHLHWSVTALSQNRAGVRDLLAREIYAEPALVPAARWLDDAPPSAPRLAVTRSGDGLGVRWTAGQGERAWLWLFQLRTAGVWRSQVLPGATTAVTLPGGGPDVIAVTAIDRVGNASAPAVLQAMPSNAN